MAPRIKPETRIRNAEKLYGAEKLTQKELRDAVNKIRRSAWWRKNRRAEADLILSLSHQGCNAKLRPNTPTGLPVEGCGMNAHINLGAGESGTWTLLHLCHQVAHYTTAGDADLHGPEFAKAYLETIRKFMGDDAKRCMTALFRDQGVKYIVWSKESREAASFRAARQQAIQLRKELNA